MIRPTNHASSLARHGTTPQPAKITTTRNKRQRAWTVTFVASLILCLFGGNLIHLHHYLPDPELPKTSGATMTIRHRRSQWRPTQRRRVEQYTQEMEERLWMQLEDQLEQRQKRCSISTPKHNATTLTKQSGHMRGHPVRQLSPSGSNLLTSLREYRQQNPSTDKKMHCYLPSSCPVLEDETKIAMVLVIGEQQPMDWRQVLVDIFKMTGAVHEVWIFIAQRVWTFNNSDKDDAFELYKQRFRKWQQQEQDDDSRIRVVVVEEGSWIRAMEQLDSESAATTLVWAQVRNSDQYASLVMSWQNFVHHRVQQWREMPFPIHVSFWLELAVDSAHNFSFNDAAKYGDICHRVESHHFSFTRQVTSAGVQKDATRVLPSIHGLVHDRSWLCFWKHPILQRFLQDTEWQVASLAATLWMAHLAGTQSVAMPDESIAVDMNDATVTETLELINFFGGVGLPIHNTAIT